MRKRVFTLMASLVCLVLLAVVTVCTVLKQEDHAHRYLIHAQEQTAVACVSCGAYNARPIDATVPFDIDIEILDEELSRPYNARPMELPHFTAAIPEPRINFFWYERVGTSYVEIDGPPVRVGEYKVTVRTQTGADITYVGEDSAFFSISYAHFAAGQEDAFGYTGARLFRVSEMAGCGEDRISYAVEFENCNVGADVMFITLSGENSENYVISPDYRASIVPAELDASLLDGMCLQKTYDATPGFSLVIGNAEHPDIPAGESVAVRILTNVADVCDDVAASARILSEDSNYSFYGVCVPTVSIDPVWLAPPTDMPYAGSAQITLELSTGIAGESVMLSLCFESENVGASLCADGAMLLGEKAGNYRLPGNYTAQIVPRIIRFPSGTPLNVEKRFDGTNAVSFSFKAGQMDGVLAGETLVITGTVDQIYPCEGVLTAFTVTSVSNPNYVLENTPTLRLTVKKAVLKLSGTHEIEYNGYAQAPLAYRSEYASGMLEEYPVSLFASFDSDAPGAGLLHVTVYGEHAALYELDDSEFRLQMTARRLSFNADHAVFAVNGSQTRLVFANKSYLLTDVAHGDEVYAVLIFSSAEAGAVLIGVELRGEDAGKYVPDFGHFTATLQ